MDMIIMDIVTTTGTPLIKVISKYQHVVQSQYAQFNAQELAEYMLV